MWKKYLGSLAIITAVMLVAIMVSFSLRSNYSSGASNGGTFDIVVAPINGNYLTASTTPIYDLTRFTEIAQNATSSFSFNTTKASSVDLNFNFYSTTTPATLVWQYAFSDDNVHWYNEDSTSQSGGVITHLSNTASSTPLYHQWIPLTATSTVSKSIHLSQTGFNFVSNYVKISLSCWGIPVNGSCLWWGEYIISRPY